SVTGLPMVQMNVVLVLEVPSSARTVTVYGPPAAAPIATVPLMVPVEELMERPNGKPVAAYVFVPPPEALIGSEMLSPSSSDWSPGLVMEIGLSTVQVNVCAAV